MTSSIISLLLLFCDNTSANPLFSFIANISSTIAAQTPQPMQMSLFIFISKKLVPPEQLNMPLVV